jgi:methylase of polypeptide subunit release factors
MLEIGNDQGQPVQKLLQNSGRFGTISIEKDHNNLDRLALAIAKTT